MIDEMIKTEDEDMLNLEKRYDSDSEDESDEEDSYLLWNGRPIITKEKTNEKDKSKYSILTWRQERKGVALVD